MDKTINQEGLTDAQNTCLEVEENTSSQVHMKYSPGKTICQVAEWVSINLERVKTQNMLSDHTL